MNNLFTLIFSTLTSFHATETKTKDKTVFHLTRRRRRRSKIQKMRKIEEREISNLPQVSQDRINELMHRAEDGDAKAFNELISMFPDVSSIFVTNTGIDGSPVKVTIRQEKPV